LTRQRIHILTPVGLLALAAGILLRFFTHANHTEFAGGFLIGLSIVFMIAGLMKR
jgi:hypothetical protein